MAVIKSKDQFPVDNQASRLAKGKLVTVETGQGQGVKVYEADLKQKPKIPADNKILKPASANKASAPVDYPVQSDPFDEIAGLGVASARALNAHQIFTFDQLAAAGELDYLSARVNASIEAWRIEVYTKMSD